MGLLFRLAELLIVLVPLVGVIVAGVRAWQRAQSPEQSANPAYDDVAATPAERTRNAAAQWRAITRTLDEHARTDDRWLDYELDVTKLLDYPLMTDMRDPLITAFHKAKLRADVLRPAKAEDLVDDRASAERYLSAVEDYVTAFNTAEAEAIRRRRSDFSREGQQRIARAHSLLRVAADPSATQQERERAYEVAGRELEGLLVLPATTRAGIERGIAGEIDG
ncbi:hypothetical protein [Mycobacterium sp. URHB0044]|jgi:hypothetical protein|uniref:hypothetical protein n=1 Tax=Mycobacterium sp. URHB0044 TaxID=1380386 RepID=UPI00048EB9BB|nr:hypothetical protein [Mycobacterium sp. URHB0044]